VLAKERHDLFLSALAVVHKKQRLSKEEVETTAYLMMQTGNPTDNFHGWVRLAMWARFYGSDTTRRVLVALKTPNDIEALYQKYTVENLKAFRGEIQARAKALGWSGRRAYIVGSDRRAERKETSVDGLRVDLWKLIESRKKDVLSEFRLMTKYYEEQCDTHLKRKFTDKELDRVQFRACGWSETYSDSKLLSALHTCLIKGVDPYWAMGFHSDNHGGIPFPESLPGAAYVINQVGYRYSRAAAACGAGYGVQCSFAHLLRAKGLSGFYAYLLGDNPVYCNVLAIQLAAASLGVNHLYFVGEECASIDKGLPEMFSEIFKGPVRQWVNGIATNPGVIRYFKGCLPGILVPVAAPAPGPAATR
jgi:hypothetical protein